MKFPSIAFISRALRAQNGYIRAELPTDARAPRDESGDLSVEVRLQVYPDGDWRVHIGDPSYDLDHHGFWGSSSLDGKRFDSRAMARDLIDQCRESYAQATDAEDPPTSQEIRDGQTTLINAEYARLAKEGK